MTASRDLAQTTHSTDQGQGEGGLGAGVREIPLTKGKVALVDAADFEWLSQWKWYPKPGNVTYACGPAGAAGARSQSMHRLIMGAIDGQFIDHINGDGLDNRRANLRFCTLSENARNARRATRSQSGYKGVERLPYGRWRAAIWIGGGRTHLGIFNTAEAAALAYDASAIETYGAFARLNFPVAA